VTRPTDQPAMATHAGKGGAPGATD